MLIPSLVFSLLAAFAMWVFVRRNPATDPRVTVAILALLLVLPLLNFLPKYSVTVAGNSESASSPSPWVFPAIWTVGFLFFGLRGLIDVLSMQRWNRESRLANDLPAFQETLAELGISRRVDLRIHPRLTSPVVSGLIRPRIYLPESSTDWSPQTLKMALLHELGHVQRRDLWMATLAHIVCVLHWFNPAVWWLRRTFLSQCEYACDAHLVEKGTDPRIYANALCDVAQSASAPPLSLAMAGHVPLRERIIFLSRGGRRGSVLLSGLILLTASSAIAMSMIRFVPERAMAPLPAPMNEVDLRFSADPFPGD
ncbi:M56 family metallopeptidase [Akkermansiaceae bacterium]|jgi:beta-lactamase regulating signal transducer with metallopeptidase domain|nr:M56 family metallopeptidase [Akkermansiaceae bacterium]MDA7868615.1 M56 family metallopeptidase [bacterium]MDA7892149.1 M56 family metallopeptidase [Akkermansiaceae bacterium]MDA7896196.1 M56 family metallopeptidase [bacterium]MDA7933419.1 M56 family metallopeptidase [Akkermansiaceae bacterium]